MDPLQRFTETYNRLDRNTLDLLATIYAEDIVFKDPAHEIQGLQALTTYFANLYENVASIQFTFNDKLLHNDQATLAWTMTFRHPRLSAAKPIVVDGATWLRFNASGKAVYHRDYFDLGAMLYEHLPLLGTAVKAIKRRIGQ